MGSLELPSSPHSPFMPSKPRGHTPGGGTRIPHLWALGHPPGLHPRRGTGGVLGEAPNSRLAEWAPSLYVSFAALKVRAVKDGLWRISGESRRHPTFPYSPQPFPSAYSARLLPGYGPIASKPLQGPPEAGNEKPGDPPLAYLLASQPQVSPQQEEEDPVQGPPTPLGRAPKGC